MTALWILVISRMMIGLAAGEIAIRYAAWSYLLKRSSEKLTATPIIFGISLWALARFGIEFRWMILMSIPHNAENFRGIAEGDVTSEVMRIILLAALFFLTYPVTKIQYRHSLERAVVETAVRVFLIVVSVIAGWVLATIHLTHI